MNIQKQIIKKSKIWIALIIGMTMSGISIFIFKSLVNAENHYIKKLVNTQLIATEDKIKSQIDTRILGLQRMANRREISEAMTKKEWEADATSYIQDYPGYQAIEWIDADYYIRWGVSLQGNEAVINMNVGTESKPREALEKAKNLGKPYIGNTFELFQGGKGFLAYIPVYKQETFDGFILGVFKIKDFLYSYLSPEVIDGYQIFVYEDSELIYSTVELLQAKDSFWKQETNLDYKGINWRIILIPNQTFIQSHKSLYPKVILITGLIISWLLAFTIYLSLKEQKRNKILKQEIKQRQETEETLSDTMTLQKAILDSANYSIISTKPDGIIQAFNRGAEKMLGYSADEVIDKVTPAKIHDLQEVVEEAKNLSQELGMNIEPGFEVFVTKAKLGLKYGRNWTYIRKDGSRFPVYLSITALHNNQGKITGFLGIANDITERQKAESELKKAFEELEIKKTEAEVSNRAKSEFLAIMSHEIRTPMNGVIGMTGLLLDTHLSAQQKDFVETIRHSGDSLLTIINDILDFSKIESGKIELENQPFNLQESIESALDLLAHSAYEKKIELIYYWKPSTPKNIIGDVTRVRQIIVNLLSNAVKFTEKGEVILSVSSKLINEDLKHNDYEIKFAVKDTGIGIPEKLQNRLFKPFSQIDASTSRKYGGTGLGLVICKRLAEMMGGEMWLESQINKGSTFYFTITAEAIKNLPKIIPLDLQDKNVLIVDDNKTNCQILTLQLRNWGMKSVAIQQPEKVLDYGQEISNFDLIILDWQMPHIDGLTLAEKIRAFPNGKNIPLIMLTSLGIPNQDIVTKINFSYVVSKPIKQSKLYNIIASIFSQDTSKKITPKKITPVENITENSTLRILLAEDNLVNQKVALFHLKKLGYRADVAANGLEVIEAMKRQFYDVILMDMQMPEMDGLEATRWLRENLTTQPYIIAMTANAMEGDRQICLDAGMNDYLSKPVRLDSLKQALLTIDN